jgi:hypothetical protein
MNRFLKKEPRRKINKNPNEDQKGGRKDGGEEQAGKEEGSSEF